MILKKKKFILFLATLVILLPIIQIPSYSYDNLAEFNYVGPGLYETDLVVIEGGERLENYTTVGNVSVWNTRNELFIEIRTDENWLIKETMIFVGNEDIPVSIGGNPKMTSFPYIEKFKEVEYSYTLVLKLVDDLDMSWGRRDEEKRIPKIAVCAKVRNIGEEDIQENQLFAWAEGTHQFEVNSGWYVNYAVVHPKTGHFIDSPVEGVNYETPTAKGKTDEGGAFDYVEGEDVEFYIGEVYIGKAKAAHKITPYEVFNTTNRDDERAVNMAMLLQSFDSDGDTKAGIKITDNVSDAFNEVLEELAIEEVDFSDTELIQTLITETDNKTGNSLNIVSQEEAKQNLKDNTDSDIFRKNISKTEGTVNTKAKLELMQGYVPAQKANGDPVDLEYYERVYDENGDYVVNLLETRNEAKPLITAYTDEVPGTGASDVFAAVSRDDGASWKITNISKSADKSSFELANGQDYPGDVRKPQVRIKGNYVLVAWTSTFARTGKPTYAIKTEDEESEDYYPYDDPYYEEDIWGVSGPQRSLDYTDLGYPEVGEIPFSVVWTCRGVINEETGEITWYKPERLTSGRRDACQIMMEGAEDVGFAVVWQEDPEGLRPGEQAGPGEGWSGATTNHKTDIWYSFIDWDEFEEIDINYINNGASSQKEEEDEDLTGRPKSLVPFKLPVRLSDNDTVNLDNMKVDYSSIQNQLDGMAEGDYIEVNAGEFTPLIEDENSQGTHQYGYVNLAEYYPYLGTDYRITDKLSYEINNQGVDKYIAVTPDGRLLDGNTGASRPNIKIQKYQKPDGTFSGWAVICYEETKGVGSGPPVDMDEDTENTDGDSGTTETSISLELEEPETVDGFTAFSLYGDDKAYKYNNEKVEENTIVEPMSTLKIEDKESTGEGGNDDGVGEQRGKNAYVPDLGKNVIYHTFDFSQPDLVSGGEIINPQVVVDTEEEIAYYTREDGTLPGIVEENGIPYLYLVDEDGELLTDWDGLSYLPAYENARRPRFIIQGKSAAIAGKADDEKATIMVMVYKMGEDGKGRPSDIYMHRWEVSKLDKGNPYQTKYMVEEIMNISSVSITDFESGEPGSIINEDKGSSNNEEESTEGKGLSQGEGLKVLHWDQTELNLLDNSFTNPYDDARAHRGILKGDMLAIAYDWTPNWAAARNGNDIFNLYVRRSFDGGKTFTTNPTGEGVEHINTYKTQLGDGTGSEGRDYEPKIEEIDFYLAGEFEPSRNLSQLTNNKESVIEPRLVGPPPTITNSSGGTYPEDKNNKNVYWVTYGTSTNPGKKSTEDKEPMDLYYSYTDDFGDTYHTVEKIPNPDSKGKFNENYLEGEEVFVWDWLAKDTGNKVAAQAECQIRMSPSGEVFYAVWNEAGDKISDVMFRRIIPSGVIIEGVVTQIDETPPVITIKGIADGDTVNEKVNIQITLDEPGTWTAELTSDGTTDTYTKSFNVEDYGEYTLKVEAEDLNGNISVKTITFTIADYVPTIEVLGIENNTYTTSSLRITIDTTGESEEILLTKDGVPQESKGRYNLDEEGKYKLVVVSESKGLRAEKNVTFVIDKTPPKISIKGIEDGKSYLGSAKPIVEITDNYSTKLNKLEIKLNDRDFLSSTKITKADDYTISVLAEDEAGNISELTLDFSVKEKRDNPSNREGALNDGEIPESNPQEFTGQLVQEEGKSSVVTGYNLTILIPENTFNEPVDYIITKLEEQAYGTRILKIGDDAYDIKFMDSSENEISEFPNGIDLIFEYDEENLPKGLSEEDIKILYYDEDLEKWIAVPYEVDTENNTVSATVYHLS
ncbi:MAG: choice-of-anchor O protein, partial [Bacillota bacterium]|nr:choice-of-anchor O protein [Bacillota bacterium]